MSAPRDRLPVAAEKNERPGDSWRKRYKSLCLHGPVWYDHLPDIDFPKNWPVFSPKDNIGDWLEFYTTVIELNYWARSTAKSGRLLARLGSRRSRKCRLLHPQRAPAPSAKRMCAGH
jgi:cation diffusion facilitator CzcD-associated flavoprotein CzcO